MTKAQSILQIHQLVTRHLAEIETAIDDAFAAGLGAELILPLRGARNMYRRWLDTAGVSRARVTRADLGAIPCPPPPCTAAPRIDATRHGVTASAVTHERANTCRMMENTP